MPSCGGHRWAMKMTTAFSSCGGHQEATAENVEKTAAVVVETLANAHAQGKTATVISGKLAIRTQFNREI